MRQINAFGPLHRSRLRLVLFRDLRERRSFAASQFRKWASAIRLGSLYVYGASPVAKRSLH